MNEDRFLKVAKQAAIEAGKIISKYYGKKLRFYGKGDSSNFATQADLEAEKVIIKIISKNFPGHNIISEEKGEIPKNSEYTWAVDPLDGTFTFSHGLPFFAVSIGLLKVGKPLLGVINHISAEDLYWASKGEGAYLNGQRICVSKQPNLDTAAFTLGFGHRAKRPSKFDVYIKPLINKVGFPYAIGSAATTLALVASGKLDGYVAEAWIWDFAAGSVIIEEAGGKVTALDGQEPDWSKNRFAIIASNKPIYNEVLQALKDR